VSAVPIEHSDAWLNTFVSERHASIQNHAGFLQDLQNRLIQSQVRTGHIRGNVAAVPAPALSLRVEDVYVHGTAIALQATVKNVDPDDVELVRMKVTSATTNAVVFSGPCARVDGEWTAGLPPLPPDTYRVVVTAPIGVTAAIDPVHDVFVVVEA
jgi:hypothetical protein